MPPPPGTTLRLATPDDAALIAGLHVRSWRFAYRDFLPADYLDGLDPARHADAYWRPVLANARPGSHTWVAEVGGEPAGFAAIEGPDGVPPPEEAVPGCGYVHHIHVVSEFLDRGVGAALWRAALGAIAAAGHRGGTLAVYEPNMRARAFYERMGWGADGWSTGRAFPSTAGDVVITMLRYRGGAG